MHPDVAALLTVQADDIEIHELEAKLATLMPRIDAITKERDRAYAALEQACELTGDNRTDTINRALLVYTLVQEMIGQGGGSLTIVNKDGEKERLHIL